MNAQEVDLILHNAKVYTVDPSFNTYEAIAVKDARIVAVGTDQSILSEYSGDKIDVEGRAIYPGFIDPHCHFKSYGETKYQAQLFGTSSIEEIMTILEEFSYTGFFKGEWLLGRGWDQNDWAVQEFPDAAILDSLFPDIPVYLTRIDGHAAWVNSKAMELAGINAETKVDGGKVLLEKEKPKGILIDNAMDLVRDLIPKDIISAVDAINTAQNDCFAVGLTSVGDAWMDKDYVNTVMQMQKAGDLKMRMYGMMASTGSDLEFLSSIGRIKNDHFNLAAVKFFVDGALGSRGAALIEDYSDDAGNKGLFMHDLGYLKTSAELCRDNNWQMCTHAIGDSANRVILDIYGEVLGEGNDQRWRIEHCQVVHPDDFEKFTKYNVIPSVQSTHATSDMYWAEERLGGERINGAYAFQTLLQATGMIVNGSDFPIEHINPLFGFYAAVTRQDQQSFPENGFLPSEKLSRKEALKAMTIWAAYAQFEEDEKGSIEVGKLADLTILEQDIMEIEEERLFSVPVWMTIVGGEVVFSK